MKKSWNKPFKMRCTIVARKYESRNSVHNLWRNYIHCGILLVMKVPRSSTSQGLLKKLNVLSRSRISELLQVLGSTTEESSPVVADRIYKVTVTFRKKAETIKNRSLLCEQTHGALHTLDLNLLPQSPMLRLSGLRPCRCSGYKTLN